METYISLLRGINVSGKKKIIMVELKAMYNELGFENVITYIQSGNVLFKSKNTNKKQLSQTIKKAIQSTFGFDVTVLVLSAEELIAMELGNPYRNSGVEQKFLGLTFLEETPDQEKVEALKQLEFPGEEFEIIGRVIYLSCPNGFGRSKFNNSLFESKLKVRATNRNLRSTRKLIELAEGMRD